MDNGLSAALQQYQDAQRKQLIDGYASKLGGAVEQGLSPLTGGATPPTQDGGDPNDYLKDLVKRLGMQAQGGLGGEGQGGLHNLLSTFKYNPLR